jgi:hypothetical protein
MLSVVSDEGGLSSENRGGYEMQTKLFEPVEKATGYPDCVVKQGDRVTHLEIKTGASIQKGSSRYLKSSSFSSGKKIKWDVRHLLLKEQLEEEGHRIWKVVA